MARKMTENKTNRHSVNLLKKLPNKEHLLWTNYQSAF